ncbi:hypothetical protein SAMN04487906_3221 [Zhouia amylolytica]|uniref:Carboxypeptidase-like regulatory domain-containing protein n=3 Tax=Zhouia amylolytica TaxID=376730 RepID=W2UPP7_9FLAO|nr:hypothetical protein P278_09890 [Zhouia amylolytica AD3]SFT14611.1 hypothetical protein SAMN04487906_3221 [Zhouia amylolytica]
MIKKMIFCAFAIVLGNGLIAQNITISGKIIDEGTREPIFGVALMLNDRIICYSNDEGAFKFEIDNSHVDEIISFHHFSYPNKALLISKLKSLQTIQLVQMSIPLEEVVISSAGKLTKKEILKRAVKQYEDSGKTSPYWSDFNYKQTIYNNSKPQGFLESDGYILMPEKISSWNSPIIVPNQMRRLNEDPEIAELDFKDMFVNNRNGNKIQIPFKHIGGLYMRSHWRDYGSLAENHPLSNKGFKYFRFNIDKIINQGDEEFYVIDFKQHKTISNKGWELTHMQGKLWVNKRTFGLHKLITQFRHRWHYSYINYDIQYQLFEDKLFPYEIDLSTYKYQTSSGEHNVVKRGTVKLNTIYKANTKNPYIHGGGDGNAFVWYDVHETYNPEYWIDRPLSDIRYRNDVFSILGKQNWDSAFVKGASQKEYKANSLAIKGIEFFEDVRNEFITYMEKDLNINE